MSSPLGMRLRTEHPFGGTGATVQQLEGWMPVAVAEVACSH